MRDLAKRCLDVALAAAALSVALPVMGLVGATIALETPGGMLFRQRRVGRGGRSFEVLKLRTMVKDAERIGAGLYAEPGDARFTHVGRWARRYSLDELPQLFNVLRGEMSLVGPRPMPPVIVEQYREAYDTILRVRPGLTGLAQVSGRNDLVRSQRLAFDQQYARTWTLLGDVHILLRTVGVLMTGEGQRNDQGLGDVER